MDLILIRPQLIFFKNDVQDINSNDLNSIQHYPTRTGRRKDTLGSLTTSLNYYSLRDAATLLKISPNKVAVLVQKGILNKDKKTLYQFKSKLARY